MASMYYVSETTFLSICSRSAPPARSASLPASSTSIQYPLERATRILEPIPSWHRIYAPSMTRAAECGTSFLPANPTLGQRAKNVYKSSPNALQGPILMNYHRPPALPITQPLASQNMTNPPVFALPNSLHKPPQFNSGEQPTNEWSDLQGGMYLSHNPSTLQYSQSNNSQQHRADSFSHGNMNSTQHNRTPSYTVAMHDLVQRPSSQPISVQPHQPATSQPSLGPSSLPRSGSSGPGLPQGSHLVSFVITVLARVESLEKALAETQARLASSQRPLLNEKTIANQFRCLDEKCRQNETRTNEVIAWIKNVDGSISSARVEGEDDGGVEAQQRMMDDNSFSALLSDSADL